MGRLEQVGRSFLAVTPSDSNNLAKGTADGFYVGTAGNIRIRGQDGDEVTFVGVSGILPCGGLRVLATGTTATNIIAIYGAN